MNQKGFSPILIIVLIAILGLVVAFRTGYVTINQPASLYPIRNKTVTTQSVTSRPSLNTPPPVFQDNGPYPTDPTTVTQNFYNWYVSCLNLHFWNANNNKSYGNVTPDQSCDYKISRYVSSELIQNLTKYDRDFMKNCEAQYPQAAAMGGCDHGDLILCAQSVPDHATVGTTSISGNTASTQVQAFSGRDSIDVSLKLINNKWQLTNLACINK